jgi:Domain of unknown function (DUF6894)
MPLYHFNLLNGSGLIPDEEGRELPDLETARAEGIRGARSIIAEEVLDGHVDLSSRLEITDEAGNILIAISFADTVEVSF